jgi:hypothetical protein
LFLPNPVKALQKLEWNKMVFLLMSSRNRHRTLTWGGSVVSFDSDYFVICKHIVLEDTACRIQVTHKLQTSPPRCQTY